jgi:hypothetical protein
MKNSFFSIALTGIWITISEFLRNEILLKDYWANHYDSLGLKFETLPVNGLLWTIWSFLFAFLIHSLLRKFSRIETLYIAWIFAFLMMWITIFNLQILPLKILLFAVPLSVFEIWVSIVLVEKLKK